MHGLYSTGDVVDRIREHFGDAVVDGAGGISRPALAGIVFSDEAELRWLEDLLHPFVREAVDDWIEEQKKARPRPALIVVEVPLLFEAGFDQRFDFIMLITAPDDLRRRRLTAKLTDSEFRRRRAQQMPEEEKISAQRLRVRQHRAAQGAAGVRGADGGEHPRRRATRRGGRRRREHLVRRALIGSVLVAVALAAVLGAARWVAPLFATGAPSWYTKTVYPLEHTDAIRDGARRYDLEPALVAAVIYAESRFDEHARSSQGAVGLMQILPETAEQIAGESGGVTFTTADLEDPRVNVRYGCYYLRQALDALRRRRPRRRRVVQRRHGRRLRVARRGGRRRARAAPPRHPVPGDAGVREEGPRGAPGIPGDVRRPPAAGRRRTPLRPPTLANTCSYW